MYMYNVAHCIGYMYSSSLSVFVWHRLEKLWRRLASPKTAVRVKIKVHSEYFTQTISKQARSPFCGSRILGIKITMEYYTQAYFCLDDCC